MVLLVLVLLHSVLVVVLVGEIQQASSLTDDGFCSREIWLVRDELHLAWKVDEIRRQQQEVTKSCSQVGQFSSALKQNIQEVTEISTSC